MLKFKVKLVTSKESADRQNKRIGERAEADRRHTIEATLVRIMKS